MFIDVIADSILPDKTYKADEWGDEFRYIYTGAEVGKMRIDRTPYAREILQELSEESPTQEVVLMAGAQLGKALCIKTPIPTPNGWKNMGDLSVGDIIYDENGYHCKVTFATEIMYDRPCYNVSFSDGTSIVADAEHKWSVTHQKNKKTLVLTTKEMLDSGLLLNGSRKKYSVPVTKPVKSLKDTNFSIHPYVLGIWLGDGRKSGNRICMSKEDSKNVLDTFLSLGEYSELCDKHSKGDTCEIVIKNFEKNDLNFGSRLKEFDLIDNKHIPNEYLFSTPENRLNLLQGLMDSDGYITSGGYCSFYSVDDGLANQVLDLVNSLGLVGRIVKKKIVSNFNSNYPFCYSVSFTAYKETPVFKLRRKLIRQKDRSSGRSGEVESRRIVDITPVDSVPVRCIQVDSPNHLFLAGKSFIPTHNTETANTWIGYCIHQHPAPILYVMPTSDMAKRTSKQRLNPLIEMTPCLKDTVKALKSRDSGNTLMEKEFAGGTLALTGANSPVGLRSMPVRYLYLDEIDAFPLDVGGEGDPFKLALKRTATYRRNRKIFITSTPTTKGLSHIERLYLDSDQRKFFVPCPHCGDYILIEWKYIKWDKKDPSNVYLVCKECGSVIEERMKTRMMMKGEWRATNPSYKGERKGYHISALYSPLGWYTWADAVADHLEAMDSVTLRKTWVNTVLGETFEEEGKKLDENVLYARREFYSLDNIPKDIVLLTAGVDTQDDRLEVTILGWGGTNKEEVWVMTHRVLYGHMGKQEVWDRLSDILNSRYGNLNISLAFIDSGGHYTKEVYDFTRRQRNATAIKGTSGQKTNPIARPSTANKGRVPLVTIGVDKIKDIVYSRFDITEVGQGYVHFPNIPEIDLEYFAQLASETKRTKYVKGYPQIVWEKDRNTNNEALDCFVYAYSAMAYLNPVWGALKNRTQSIKRTPETETEVDEPKNIVKKVAVRRRRLS